MPEGTSIESREPHFPGTSEPEAPIDASSPTDGSLRATDPDSGGPVDFSRAARLDSSALRALLALDFALKRSGGELRTHALNDGIREYLRLRSAVHASGEQRR